MELLFTQEQRIIFRLSEWFWFWFLSKKNKQQKSETSIIILCRGLHCWVVRWTDWITMSLCFELSLSLIIYRFCILALEFPDNTSHCYKLRTVQDSSDRMYKVFVFLVVCFAPSLLAGMSMVKYSHKNGNKNNNRKLRKVTAGSCFLTPLTGN